MGLMPRAFIFWIYFYSPSSCLYLGNFLFVFDFVSKYNHWQTKISSCIDDGSTMYELSHICGCCYQCQCARSFNFILPGTNSWPNDPCVLIDCWFWWQIRRKDLMMMLSSVLFILIYFSVVVKSFAFLVQSNATASSV